MSLRRITATSKLWQHPIAMAGDQHKAEPEKSNFTAKASPSHTKVLLDNLDASVAAKMSSWLRKHGRALKPKMSAEQGKQLQQCFRLMDADGSGAIGADELSSAFKLLGIKAKKSTIEQMIADAGADESGEVGYDAFVTMMEPILSCKDTGSCSTTAAQTVVKSGSAVSFETLMNEYRRKKIIEALHERDTEVLSMLSAALGATGAGLPAVQAISTVTAPPMPSTNPRSHSASSDVVEAALRERNALVSSSKRAALSQQQYQRARQVLSDKGAAQPFLPDLQAATQKTDSTNMLRGQMGPFAAHDMSLRAHNCTAAAACSIHRQGDSHLAALKAQGDLDSVLPSAAFKQNWPAQQQLHLALTKATPDAGLAKSKQKSKPVRDMFGVAADNDSSTGVDLGLVLMRPASSLL